MVLRQELQTRTGQRPGYDLRALGTQIRKLDWACLGIPKSIKLKRVGVGRAGMGMELEWG
ncbi:MAG: hypothetical protein WA118_07620 [Carboxydocellales bacterium]